MDNDDVTDLMNKTSRRQSRRQTNKSSNDKKIFLETVVQQQQQQQLIIKISKLRIIQVMMSHLPMKIPII